MSGGKRDKRGSTTVFLCMILSSLLLLAGVLGEAAAGMASRSYGNRVFDLAGRSLLSEYDRALKDQYGIFGFLMEEEALEAGMRNYAEESFTTGIGKTNLLTFTLEEIRIDSSEHVLTNPELLEQQILEHMGYRVIFDALHLLDALRYLDADDTPMITEEEQENAEEKKMRTLRNEKIIGELPSRLLKGIDSGLKNILDLPSPDAFGKIAYEELCLNLYIVKYFRHDLDQASWDNTFFFDEVEYILAGRLSDESNHTIVYLSLLAFRTIINAAHIHRDALKWEAVTAAAALAGGGVATVPATAAITAIWAGAEAAMDLQRLERGERVPLIKTADDWVLDLDNALEGDLDREETVSGHSDGLSYEEYLFLLLCFKDRESKLIRIMDLIQLNMKGNVNEHFAMNRCCSGFRYYAKVFRSKGFPGVLPFRIGEFQGVHVY